MDRLSWLGPALAALVFLAPILSHAASPVLRSEDFQGTRVVDCTTTATQVISTGTGGFWQNQVNQRNEVCWVNMSSDTLTSVFLSTFSMTDTTIYGWPVRGTEKECHDLGADIPLYCVNASGDAVTRTVRFWISK